MGRLWIVAYVETRILFFVLLLSSSLMRVIFTSALYLLFHVCLLKSGCHEMYVHAIYCLTEAARAAINLSGTMLGYYPVKVLPSKTAIAPVNPTLLPQVG